MTRSIVAFVTLLGTAGLTSVAKKLFSVIEATIPEIQKSHEKEATSRELVIQYPAHTKTIAAARSR